MKTLLVLSQHPDLVETIRTGLNPEQYRLLHRTTVDEAEPLLAHGLADACIIDVELSDVQGVWFLEKLRRRAPKCPVIIYTGARKWEWEEEAYLQGAAHVLSKPARPRILASILDRLWVNPNVQQTLLPLSLAPVEQAIAAPAQVTALPATQQALVLLRDFSAILSHSLNAEGMMGQFMSLIRDLFSVNRGAIFLRQPGTEFGNASTPQETQRLRSVCAMGLSNGLLQHLELSLDGGIGGQLTRSGRILRRNSDEARNDLEIQKEFEVLGAQVAVPILDRETVLGVAVFDRRITGEPLVNSELELIFHLLEHLGLAVKNIWLHDQLASNHEMMTGILRELSSACVVVGRDLGVLHSNKMARRYFTTAERRGSELEFSDLPQILGSKVYQVLKTGSALSRFKYEPEGSTSQTLGVSIVPFQRSQTGLPASALMMVEDLTQSQQLQHLEIEAANLRLVKAMADRLAHEIGNAMVPLSTHQQLLGDKYKDPEFRASLDAALADGVKRVTRLINQLRFLARDSLAAPEAFPLAPLIEEAYHEARKYLPIKTGQFKFETGSSPIVLTGDRAALKHAISEVMLNALQANPADPKIGVRLNSDSNGNGTSGLQIEVQDNGAGFTAEAALKAPSPFFTTRSVGLGLGLTVSRKIIETHHGKLEILPPKSGQAGTVRICLPLDATLAIQN